MVHLWLRYLGLSVWIIWTGLTVLHEWLFEWFLHRCSKWILRQGRLILNGGSTSLFSTMRTPFRTLSKIFRIGLLIILDVRCSISMPRWFLLLIFFLKLFIKMLLLIYYLLCTIHNFWSVDFLRRGNRRRRRTWTWRQSEQLLIRILYELC